MMHISPQQLAAALSGEVSGNEVLAPGPGHSPRDRSLSIKIDPGAPDGFVAYPSVLFYHHSTFTVGDDSAGAAVRYGVCSFAGSLKHLREP